MPTKKKAKAKHEPKVIGEIYLHVCNGGLTVRVLDYYGPTLEIEASAFGHTFGHTRVHTNRYSLRKIANMILKAADSHVFQPDYCHAAEAEEPGRKGKTEDAEEEVVGKDFGDLR